MLHGAEPVADGHRVNIPASFIPTARFSSSTDPYFVSPDAAGAWTGGVEARRRRRDRLRGVVAHSFGSRTISMRRFLARPSGVALSATGLNSPNAAEERLAGSIPCFWR